MIDTLLADLDRARERGAVVRGTLGLDEAYGLLTLHRPSNVDEAASLQRLVETTVSAAEGMAFLFPAHPRTAARLVELEVALPPSVQVVEPMGYLDVVGVMDGAALVLTDSGGVQEETSVLGVPCVTLRDNTERPITCELGTNRLVGTDPAAVLVGVEDALRAERAPASIPLWDGHAGERIASVLLGELG